MKTPQLAIDKLGRSGGTVQLAGGTYARQRIRLTGRSDVTVRAAPGAAPVLDGSGLAVPKNRSGMVEIRNSADISIIGLTITGYRTRSLSSVPVGILVDGSGHSIRLAHNHVHHLGNDNATLGSFDINAHGIAVYGNNPKTSISDVRVEDNELDHLVLGASETLVLNGNVDGWSVTGNNIHDDNNIGIDAIGFEDTIAGAARYTEVNRARHGIIAHNHVARIISAGNPAYHQDDGTWCNCADGIYVDGGEDITIRHNHVASSDIGIEAASEWKRGRTNGIRITGNFVTSSRSAGLALGGYDTQRGQAFDLKVSGNVFRANDTLKQGSEILLQYYLHDTSITDNLIVASTPVLVQRQAPAGSAALNAGLVLNHNRYAGPAAPGQEIYSWNGTRRKGLAAYQAASHQDKDSTYSRLRVSTPADHD